MRPVVNDRAVFIVEGISSNVGFVTEGDAQEGMKALLDAGVIEMLTVYKEERVAGIPASRQVKTMPPITRGAHGGFNISIPHEKEQEAQAALSNIEHSIESPKNLNGRMIFEDRYAALNAQEALSAAGIVSGLSHYSDMKRINEETGKIDYVIEIPRDKIVEAADVLSNANIQGKPRDGKDASPTR